MIYRGQPNRHCPYCRPLGRLVAHTVREHNAHVDAFYRSLDPNWERACQDERFVRAVESVVRQQEEQAGFSRPKET